MQIRCSVGLMRCIDLYYVTALLLYEEFQSKQKDLFRRKESYEGFKLWLKELKNVDIVGKVMLLLCKKNGKTRQGKSRENL